MRTPLQICVVLVIVFGSATHDACAGLLTATFDPPTSLTGSFPFTTVNPGDQITVTETVDPTQLPSLPNGIVAIDYGFGSSNIQIAFVSETGGPTLGVGDSIGSNIFQGGDFEFFDSAPFVTQPFTFVEQFEVAPNAHGQPVILDIVLSVLFLDSQNNILGGAGASAGPAFYRVPSSDVPEPGTLLLSTAALGIAGAGWLAKRLRSGISA
jgi:hypothetical protein